MKMNWIVIGLIIVIALVIIVLKLSQVKMRQLDYSYQKLGILFTPAERSFWGILKQVVGEEVEIFGKVRVADIIIPKRGISQSNWRRAFNKISGKHFDFILCNKSDLAIICAVELNDSSHKSINRARRDTFLQDACKSADVPLVQIPAKNVYNLNEIREHISGYIKEEIRPATGECQQEPQEMQKEKLCPKCSSIMVKRLAKKGTNAGKEFWACNSYPKCKYIEAINE